MQKQGGGPAAEKERTDLGTITSLPTIGDVERAVGIGADKWREWVSITM